MRLSSGFASAPSLATRRFGRGMLRMAALASVSAVLLGLSACSQKTRPDVAPVPAAGTDQQVGEAWVYLLGRLTVLRQQQTDFDKEGFRWNELLHRDIGGVTLANPNLDVLVSEAWIAVDERYCVVLNVPAMKPRYYTVQLLNGWGETVANINDRTFADRGDSRYGICMKGAGVQLPQDVRRVDVPGRTARMLVRIQVGKNRKQAMALQQELQLRMTGTPRIDTMPATPMFANTALPGVEAFDLAAAVLDSEPDINPGMTSVQMRVRAVAAAIAQNPAERQRIDKLIREQVMPRFQGSFAADTATRNGWTRPATAGKYGQDFAARTRTNLGDLWANTFDEMVSFRTDMDDAGKTLQGSNVYTMTFPKGKGPSDQTRYFWSVTAVDGTDFRVIPNPKRRYLLNNNSRFKYGKDGSLTLYFAPERPADAPDGNWLPTSRNQNYSLTFRIYGPDQSAARGVWFPPAMTPRP